MQSLQTGCFFPYVRFWYCRYGPFRNLHPKNKENDGNLHVSISTKPTHKKDTQQSNL